MNTVIRLAMVTGLCLGVTVPSSVQAQLVELGLDDAMARTDSVVAARAARLRADGAALRAASADGRRFPGVQLTADALTTTDPVAAFGTRLRQGRFTPADFEIARLNDPSRIQDLTVAVEVGWTVFDPALSSVRHGARQEATAARLAADRSLDGARLRTRTAYASLLEAESVERAAERAVEAAESTEAVVRRRAEEGLANDADLLRVQAFAASRRAELARAGAGREAAVAQLISHLGILASEIRPTTGLEELIEATRPSGGSGGVRPDVAAAEAAARAAGSAADAASLRRLPVLEAYGAGGVHRGGGATGERWTAGLRVSLPLLTGPTVGRSADAARLEARARSLEAIAAEREAEAERRVGSAEVEAWSAARRATSAGAEAAIEAERLLRLRYREGLATLSDLLGAQPQAAAARTEHVRAGAGLARAQAHLLFATGESRSHLPTPDGAEFDR